MRELAEKLKKVEAEIAAERGDFLLFALVQRDRTQDRWDVLLSAHWIPAKKRNTLDYVIEKLSRVLSKRDLKRISRVVILDPADPLVLDVQRVIDVEHGLAEFKNCTFNRTELDYAFVITSRRQGTRSRQAAIRS